MVGVVGLGLGDILKPDLVLPLIENLPIEQLASHLPEVCIVMMLSSLSVELIIVLIFMVIAQFQGPWTPSGILELLQSPPLRQQLDAFTHVSHSSYQHYHLLVLCYAVVSLVPSGVLILVFGYLAGAKDWANRSRPIWC